MANNQVMVSKEFVEAVKMVHSNSGRPRCHELNHRPGERHDISEVCPAEVRMGAALWVIEQEIYKK